MGEAYIVAATRTAGGRRNGRLSGVHPADLGATVIDSVLHQTGIDPAAVEDVVMGCVMQMGEQASNIARNAVLASRLPLTTPATSVDRQCGSSQQALQFAAQAIMSGTMDVVIAAGVESMSRVPLGLSAESKSPRMEEKFPGVVFSQFDGAELMADRYGLSKEELDTYSLESHRRAAEATHAGRFKAEITPVEIQTQEGSATHEVDEGIRFNATLEGVQGARLLREGGKISAAAASQICDGAAALLVVNEAGLKRHGLTPLARIHHLSVLGGDPVIMLETPIAATRRALDKAGMRLDDIDLYEVNEAFASVPLAWAKELAADPERMNVNGGAIALGHPVGASGAKLMATLVNALRQRKARYGLQTMCEGGGLANVTVVERLTD